jgi:hypothetical protein
VERTYGDCRRPKERVLKYIVVTVELLGKFDVIIRGDGSGYSS